MTRQHHSRDLAGSIVAVTGATAGIGQATAEALIRAGAHVTVQGRRVERLTEFANLHPAARVATAPGAAQDPRSADRLVRKALERFGRLDSIVISAGVGIYGGILEHTDYDLRRMIRTNIEGTLWPLRAATRHFVSEGRGDIVVIASVAGLLGGANEAVYAATKFAQVGLCGAVDRELREHGVRVSVICPASVETEFALGAGRTPGDPSMSEFLDPSDVAAAVVTVLQQPLSMRVPILTVYSMSESS